MNPGVNFDHLQPNDPALANLKIPANTDFFVFRNSKCGVANDSPILGHPSDGKIVERNTKSEAPSFSSYRTEKVQTLGSLSQTADSDNCILGISVNGPLESVALGDGVVSANGLIDPNEPGAPSIENQDQITAEGQEAVAKAISRGDPIQLQVYTVGREVSAPNPPPGFDPTAPIRLPDVAAYDAAKFFLVPMPTSTNNSTQIADLNNSIVAAVKSGAHFVLVPAVDPNSILFASQYASENGAKVYIVPKPKREPSSTNSR